MDLTWCPTCGGPVGRPEGCRLCWLGRIPARAAFGRLSHGRWTMDHARVYAVWGLDDATRRMANDRTPRGSINHYRVAAGFDPIPEGDGDPMLHPFASASGSVHLPHDPVPLATWLPPESRKVRWPPWDVDGNGWVISPDDRGNRWA